MTGAGTISLFVSVNGVKKSSIQLQLGPLNEAEELGASVLHVFMCCQL